MLDLLRKSVLAGIGAVVVTAEKVREATRKLVQEGKISTDEAEKLAEDLVNSGERQWQDISTKMSESMKKWMENVDVVRSREFQEMKTRVESLEQKVADLEEAQKKERAVVGEY